MLEPCLLLTQRSDRPALGTFLVEEDQEEKLWGGSVPWPGWGWAGSSQFLLMVS